jgi:hypothetical protein
MKESYKYLYLLQFKEEPLIKIGESTKNGGSYYDRIKSHLRTYGSVFDLENSYEVIAPKKYSITALERQLKDITVSSIPDPQTFLKYQGKDGATEIRKEECLEIIFNQIRSHQKYIDIKINQGISLVEKSKPNEIKPTKQIKQVEKETLKFPFEYPTQKHLVELILQHFYIPNLQEVNGWRYEIQEDYRLRLILDTNKSFASKIYASDFGTKLNNRSHRDLVWGRAIKSDIKIKWIYHDLILGKSEERSGITAFNINLSLISESDGDRCIIQFIFDNSGKTECSEDLEEWKKWFECGFLEPLKTHIPDSENDNLKSIWKELWAH